MALLTMYGVDTGIRTEALFELSRLVLELAGVQQPSNRPIVGQGLFHVESGIIATWVKNVGDKDLIEAFPFRPEVVGQPAPRIALGKGSGVDSVAIWLDRLGIEAATEQIQEILLEVKGWSTETKQLLSEDEFVKIVDTVMPGR